MSSAWAPATTADAIVAMRWLATIAVALGTVELWRVRRVADDDGVWRWSTLRREWPAPLAALLTPILGPRGFRALLVVRFAGAVGLAVTPHAVIAVGLFATTLLVALRWRGSWNGGSDFMTLIVLGAVAVALAGGATAARGAVWYVALQSATSYFIAGVVKLRQPMWRDGQALSGFLRTGVHGETPTVTWVVGRPRLVVVASWAVMLAELGFPLALLAPAPCVVFVGIGALFHLGNVYALGLDRFFWAWGATYPAVLWAGTAGNLLG